MPAWVEREYPEWLDAGVPAPSASRLPEEMRRFSSTGAGRSACQHAQGTAADVVAELRADGFAVCDPLDDLPDAIRCAAGAI